MTQKTLSLFLGIITILLWGSLATFGSLTVHLPPFYVLGVAFMIGSLPALFRFREMFPPLPVFLWGVGGYFGYHFFLFYAFRFAPSVEANLINYLWPVILVLLAPVAFPKEKLRSYHVVGGLLSVLGCMVLVMGKGDLPKTENLVGYLLALGAAITWPVYSIGKKRFPPTSVWAIGSFCFGAGILCLLTHAWIEPRVVLQSADALKILFMGAGPFGLAFYCWDGALARGDARVLGALAYLTPVLSTLGLVIFGGQELSQEVLVAMALIVLGASAGLLDFFPRNR